MKTLRFIFVALMTLFSVNSFSQTTHTFTIDNTDFMTTGTAEVQVGDVINFVNGYASTEFYSNLNGVTQPGFPQTFVLGQTIYSYTVPSMAPFTIKVGYSPNFYEEVSFTVTQSTADVSENSLTYKIYPNPTTDFINVDGVNVESVKIFDMNGRMVLSDTTNKVDVSTLLNGYYTIVINGSERIRIIKN